MTYRVRNLVLAFGLAALAALMVSFYVSQVKRQVAEGSKPEVVLVAAKDIPAGTPGAEIVDGKMLEQRKLAHDDIIPGALSKPEEVAGLYSTQIIYQGEQITARRFSTEATRGPRAEISGNQRVIQITNEPERLLAGTLRAGDHVDIVGTWNLPESAQHHVSRVIFRDILVIKAPAVASAKNAVAGNGNDEESVMLRLTDKQSHALFWMGENGEWSLVLRPPVHSADSQNDIQDALTLALQGIRQNASKVSEGGTR
jgi:Flp pilus assembly protein CpaB